MLKAGFLEGGITMGSLIDLNSRKRLGRGATAASARPKAGNAVSCSFCAEPHPMVRLAGGEQRCLTAFFDGAHWFCRNRGCRRAWLEGRSEATRGRGR